MHVNGFRVGQRVYARVTAIYEVGAFVEFSRFHGFIGSTEIAEDPVTDVNDHLSIGDLLYAWVCELDGHEGRIDLTLIEDHATTAIDANKLNHIQSAISYGLDDENTTVAHSATSELSVTKDNTAKEQVLTMLGSVVDDAVLSPDIDDEVHQFIETTEAKVDPEAPQWRMVEHALTLDATIRQSMEPASKPTEDRWIAGALRKLPTRLERVRRKVQHEHNRTQALRRLGVSPGEGLPFWTMYMTRRTKKNLGQ